MGEGHKYVKVMPHNCTTCNAGAVVVGQTGLRLLTCSNNNAREFGNQVDKYCHCGYWCREV